MFYFVSNSYSPNTALTNRVMAIIRGLSDLGVSTRVVFFAPDKNRSRVKDSFPNIEFQYLWDRGYIDIKGLRRLSLWWYLRKFLRSLKAGDKVYLYGFTDLVVALAKRTDICVYEERTEHVDASYYSSIIKTPVPVFLEACRRMDGMIVISQGLKQYFIDNGCHPERVHVMNMIVDSTRFKDLQKQPIEPYIAYCGTATNTKDGVDQLIKAFALVVKHHPEYKLYIIGSTPSKKQRFDNHELTKELGIEKNVVFTGIVPAEQMPQLLKNANILALDRPNNLQAKYGFPTKLGEYLLTENPVVVTEVGDIPLFLIDGESALIAAPDNTQDFADKLCWAIDHPDEANKIGKRGKAVAEKFFNYLSETRKICAIMDL